MKPNNSTHFDNFEDAFYRVPEFARNLQVNVPTTLEDGGTFQYFGSGQKVYEYKLSQEELGFGVGKGTKECF